MFGTFDISTSGMMAQRVRLTAIASNLANLHTTENAAGQPSPYQRLMTTMAAGADGKGTPGVRVTGVAKDQSPPRLVYDPTHPDAGADGYVKYPNVDLATENVDAIEATRAFQANVMAFESTKAIMASSLRILA
jgi:flagellar basal-body rod protein FlgC